VANRIVAVQVSDTTADASSNAAGNKKTIISVVDKFENKKVYKNKKGN